MKSCEHTKLSTIVILNPYRSPFRDERKSFNQIYTHPLPEPSQLFLLQSGYLVRRAYLRRSTLRAFMKVMHQSRFQQTTNRQYLLLRQPRPKLLLQLRRKLSHHPFNEPHLPQSRSRKDPSQQWLLNFKTMMGRMTLIMHQASRRSRSPSKKAFQ